MSKFLKLEYEGYKFKIFLKNYEYASFVKSITKRFQLSSSKYYHLHYTDQQRQTITISSQQDFDALLKYSSLSSTKLLLEKTDSPKLHFEGRINHAETVQENNQLLQEKIEEIKKTLSIELQQFKRGLEEKVSRELQEMGRKPINNTIHSGIKCVECKNKQDICGVRYECAICDYNICEKCEGKGHHPHHPLIKIKDETQMLMQKRNILRRQRQIQEKGKTEWEKLGQSIKKQESKMEMTQRQACIREVAQITNLSKDQVQKLMSKYPKKTSAELIDSYFSQHF